MQQQKSRIPLIALVSAIIIALGFPIASALNSSQISEGKHALYVSGDATKLELSSTTIDYTQKVNPSTLSGKSFILAEDAKDSDGKFTLGNEQVSGYTSNNWEATNWLTLGFKSADDLAQNYDSLKINFTKVSTPTDGKDRIALFALDEENQAQSVLDDGTFFIKSGSTIDLLSENFKKINQDNLKWLLTNAGTYEITASVTGSKAGKEVTSKAETFTWVTQGTPNSADSAANENESTTAPTEDPAGSSPGDTSNTEGAETESPNLDPHDSHADSEADASTENNPAAESSTGAHTDAITLNDGHVDMFYIYGEPGKLHLLLKEDVTGHGVFRSPNAVTNELGKKYYSDKIAEMKLPNGEKEGYTTWGSYFSPGLGANAYADYGMQDVKINFTEITGPGSVALFKQSISGEPIAILNDDRIYLETGTSLDINSPDHRHFQWVFSKPGKYVFTAHAEATSTDGGVITSPEVKYTWLIGEIPAASAEDNASATAPDTSQPDTTDDTKPATPQPSKPETSTKPDTGKSKKDPDTGKKENTEKNKQNAKVLPIVVNQNEVPQGGKITFTASGFTPGEQVAFTVHSTPVKLMPVTANKQGSATATWKIPADFELGKHSVTAVGLTSKKEAKLNGVFTVTKLTQNADLNRKTAPNNDAGKKNNTSKQNGTEKQNNTGKQNGADAQNANGNQNTKGGNLAQTGMNQNILLIIVGLLCFNGFLMYRNSREYAADQA